jgi:hypothetical protein
MAHEEFFRQRWCELRSPAGEVQGLPLSPTEGSGSTSSIALAESTE